MSSLPSLSIEKCYNLSHYYDDYANCLKISVHIFSGSLVRIIEDIINRHFKSTYSKSMAFVTMKFKESDEAFMSRESSRRKSFEKKTPPTGGSSPPLHSLSTMISQENKISLENIYNFLQKSPLGDLPFKYFTLNN